MWKLDNDTPYAAAYAVSQDYKTGGTIWQVAVKGTFDISDQGKLRVAEEQMEVLTAPVYRDQEDNSSMIYPADFEAQVKEKVDVLLNAHAHAPLGNSVTDIEVGVKIGHWIKQLKVIGNRHWDTSMGVMFQTNPIPFDTVPIIYEKAFGGIDDSKETISTFLDNPVGRGYAKNRSHRIAQKLPNIEYIDCPTKNKKPGKNKTAGFGAICPHWSPRTDYAGTYDDRWQEERFPLYPSDFDPRFFQCAPEDQQVSQILGGEPVILLNLTPGSGYFEFKLPHIDFQFFTKIKHDVISHRANLHTVIIEPDFPRLQMVWQTAVACHEQEQDIEHTYIACKTNEL